MKPGDFTGDLALNNGPFQIELNSGIRARLVCTDPPYNLGFDYGQVADNRTAQAYELEIGDFLAKSYDAAADDAHLIVIHYHEHFLDLAATYKAAPWKRHQIATWTYSGHTPCPTTNRLRRATRALYWATKGNPPFYLDNIRRPYRNPTDRRIKAQVKAGKTGAKATDHFHVEQVKMGSKEHLGYSNQIPQALPSAAHPGDNPAGGSRLRPLRRDGFNPAGCAGPWPSRLGLRCQPGSPLLHGPLHAASRAPRWQPGRCRMSRLSAIGLGLLALVIFPAGLLSCLTCTWRMIKHEWSRPPLPKPDKPAKPKHIHWSPVVKQEAGK